MFVDGGRERGRGCWVPGGATDARGEDEGVDMREWDERGVDGGDGVELYGGRFGSGCVDREKKRGSVQQNRAPHKMQIKG